MVRTLFSDTLDFFFNSNAASSRVARGEGADANGERVVAMGDWVVGLFASFVAKSEGDEGFERDSLSERWDKSFSEEERSFCDIVFDFVVVVVDGPS